MPHWLRRGGQRKREEEGGLGLEGEEEKIEGEEGVKPKVRSVPDGSDNQRIIQSH